MAIVCDNKLIGVCPELPECITSAYESYEDIPYATRVLTEGEVYLYESNLVAKFIDKCENKCTQFTELAAALEQAYQIFRMDLQSGLQDKYKLTNRPWHGYIGERKTRTYYDQTEDYAFDVIISNGVKDTCLILESIEVGTNFERDLEISLFRQDGELIDSFEATYSPNTSRHKHSFASALELPLTDSKGDPINYYFVYYVNGEQGECIAKGECLLCNCNGNNSISARNFGFFAHKGSGQVDSIPEVFLFDVERCNKTWCHSFTLTGSIVCKPYNVVCTNIELNETYKQQVTWAILEKSIELFLFNISTAGNLSRFTAISEKESKIEAAIRREGYNQRIGWLIDNTDIDLSDCYSCQRRRTMQRHLIRK